MGRLKKSRKFSAKKKIMKASDPRLKVKSKTWYVLFLIPTYYEYLDFEVLREMIFRF